MKTQSSIIRRLSAALLLSATALTGAYGGDLVFMSFDAGDQGFPCGGWDAERAYAWESTLDSSNNPASGSLRVDVFFTNVNYTTLQTCQGVASFTPYEQMAMDVYLDPTNTPNASGNFGTIQVRFRPGWAWPGDLFTLGTITNTGWSHLKAALPASATSASGINFHWNSGFTNNLDPRTIWLDNIVFVERVAPPAPPKLALRKSGPGLDIMTAGSPDYARRNIATVAGLAATLGWQNSTGAVTYAMTINEDVDPNSDGYAANILLCAGTDTAINASPDWNQPNGIFLEAQPNTNGTIDVSVRYKTNAPNSHGIRFSGDPTNGYPGLLIQNTNTGVKSLVGTWALTLSNATIILTGPGGIHETGTLPADALPYFGSGNNFWALFGAQPYTRNNRIISLSRVHIYGGADFTAGVDQDFTTASALDANLEIKQEGSGGVNLKPTNTAWRVWWELPDTGFYLWSSAKANTNYAYMDLTPITQGTRRAVFTTNVTASAGFYQMRNWGPSAPPVVVESFETAVPTGANPPYVSITQSTAAGVTDGTYSMLVDIDNSMTSSWIAMNYGASTYTDWKNHTKIRFDLHRPALDHGWNLEVNLGLNADGATWTQTQLVNWLWLNANTSTSETLEFDYSAMRAAAPATGNWWQLNLMFRTANGGQVYVDNVKFVN